MLNEPGQELARSGDGVLETVEEPVLAAGVVTAPRERPGFTVEAVEELLACGAAAMRSASQLVPVG